MGALLALARRYPDAVLPGFTHMRRAQAVLWPHYLLAYFEMFARDWERLGQARRAANLLPLGSGALAGSGFPFDREEIARDLGFEGITRNSMDVSADRDFVLDFLHAASLTMLHLSRLAEDWILYSSEEFGWLELGDEVTSGSSLMPQKKNPDSLELIRGKCGRVFGSYSSLFVTMKGLPLTYNRDMQEDKEPLFDAADQLAGSLEMAARGGRVGEAATRRRPPPPPRRAGWSPPTWPRRCRGRARRSTRRTSSSEGWCWRASGNGKRPSDWTPEALAAFAPEFTPEMARLLQPARGDEDQGDSGRHGPRRRWQGARGGGGAPRATCVHEQELPPRADSQSDPHARHPHAGGTGARAEGRWASPPRR